MTPALNPSQLAAYDRDGFILVSGLIPSPVVRRAESTLWSSLELDPGERTGWPVGAQFKRQTHPDLLACYTPTLLQAVAQLAGEDLSTVPAPKAVTSIVGFPPVEPPEWKWPEPHIDHAIKEDGHRTFPRPFRVASMIFLNDVAPHGGGTIVWPGSHKKIEALALSDRKRYDTMWALNLDLHHLTLTNPVELQPRQGDILFYQHLCAHAGSANATSRPRVAFNAKW